MAVLAVLWLVLCRHLGAEWSYNEQYNYGWFVPFFAAYLVWLRWEDRPEVERRKAKVESRKRGVTAAAVCLAIAILALFFLLPLRAIEVANPDWRPISWVHALVVVTLTLLLVWRLGGKPWLRHFAFPVIFFLIAVPWPTPLERPIIQGLMPTVARIAVETLSLFGVPAELQGSLIRINGGVVGVNEACSGVRSLQTSIMIGLLFGELRRMSILRRIALVVCAVAISFVANCGRAVLLVWIAATRGVEQIDHWHDFAGYAIVVLVFAGCLGLTKVLTDKQRTESKEQTADESPVAVHVSPFVIRHSSFFAATLLWLLAVEFGVEAWYRVHERNLRPSTQWTVHWPDSAPQFRDLKIDERTRSILHYDAGRAGMWRTPEDEMAENNFAVPYSTTELLFFFRWHPGHNSALLANAHRPDVCLPATGWQQTNDFGVRNYAVNGALSIPFRHFRFSSKTNGTKRLADAFYCVWEDHVRADAGNAESQTVSEKPSAWTRSERIGAVLEGRRHLGQQVMEYLQIRPDEIDPAKAEEHFAAAIRELVSPEPPQT